MGVKDRKTSADNVALAQRLRRRRGEIGRALSLHLGQGEKSDAVRDPAHSAEVEAGVAAVTEYTLDCIEKGEAADPVPPALVAWARRAVWDGVALDVFLMEVIAVFTQLNEYVLREAWDLTGDRLGVVQALQGSILLRFASELAGEYKREESRLRESSTRRLTAVVERLLAGAPTTTSDSDFDYKLDLWHSGLVVDGPKAVYAARRLARDLGTALLVVPRRDGTVWAWLGSTRRLSSSLIQEALEDRHPKTVFAVGESGRDIEGWRLTHFEARATLGVALQKTGVICFSEVALEAMALQVPNLAHSLQKAYLSPLATSHRKGVALRQTLRAYFACGRNASSAAVALRVSRRTVEKRLRSVEHELGRSLATCGAELETALRLEDLSLASARLPLEK